MATQSASVTKYTAYVTATVSGNTVSWSGYIQFNNYWHYGVGLQIYVNGTKVKDVTGYTSSGRQKCCQVSGTTTINQTHSAQTVQVYAYAYSATVSGYGGVGASATTPKISLTVPAKASYSVTYSANGGTGAPGSQTKWYGETLTLSSSKPSRTGYTFAGWNTNSAGTGTNYSAGGSYAGNAALALYAKWTANTYTVYCNANGGTGGTGSVSKTYGKSCTLPSGSGLPTRTNYRFTGWNTKADGTGTGYAAGASYSVAITANTTLYAQWELACLPPTVVRFTAYRAGEDGKESESGTRLGWQLDCRADTTVKADTLLVKAEILLDGAVVATVETGDVTTFQWATTEEAGLVQSESYRASCKVYDSNGLTASFAVNIPLPFVPLDLAKEGFGVGRFAPEQGMAVAMDVEFQGALAAEGKVSLPAQVKLGSRSFNFEAKYGIEVDEGKRDYKYLVPCDWTGSYPVLEMPDFRPLTDRYYRAPKAGFIGYDNTTSGNYLGTSSWPWNYIYGRNIYQNGNQVANKADLTAANNVLWSGGYYMTSGHTASLSKNVTNQRTGIVLIWSKYESSGAKNYDFNLTFIPKQFVSSYGGCGVCCLMQTSGGGYIARKYVYVNNTSITGNNVNNSGDASAFVLRNVIGV